MAEVNISSGKIMTHDQIFDHLVNLRYAAGVSPHRHLTRVMLGVRQDASFIIYPKDDSKREQMVIRRKLLEVFGDIDNIVIGKGVGMIVAA